MRLNRSLAYYDRAREVAVAMGQDPMEPGCDFYVPSRSGGQRYPMVYVDGYAVHQGESCLGARFRGELSCWHSKDFSTRGEEDMTSLTTYQGGQLAEVREFTDQDIETLKATICSGASDSELRLFVATCRHTGLDPFMRQIHCVMRSTKDENGVWVKRMTIQIGIDGYRLIAARSNQYQGSSEPQFTYDGATWEDIPREGVIPLASRVAVWRKGIERPLIGFARWSAYVQKNSNGDPNAVWKQRGPEQLAKCAEVQGLRKGFPAEMAQLPLHEAYIEEPDEPELGSPVASDAKGPGYVAWDEIDTKRPEQVEWQATDAYAEAEAQFAPSPQEAAERQQAELDAARETYLANHPPAPEPPAASPEEQVAQVRAMLEDCKLRWAAKDYLELGQELSIFMPSGEGRFVLSELSGDRLTACVRYLRMKRDELAPASP